MRLLLAVVVAVLPLAACRTLGKDELPAKSPPLVDMEEPVALHEEPKDEAARQALPLGSFTGLTVTEARRTLDESAPKAAGVRVSRVVENSPADAAGIDEDDVLLAVKAADGHDAALHWPSEWRRIELEAAPGSMIRVIVDRAGDERTAEIRTVPRVRAGERTAGERIREEKRVGVVLRTATEVEARAAGLGPGAGAVIVGLAAGSPWRAAGMRYEDLLVAVDGRPVGHPQELLEAIRSAKTGAKLAVAYVRGGERRTADLPLTRRAQEVSSVSIPPFYSYENDRGMAETSFGLGAIRKRSTQAAWEWRLLWLFTISGGDANKLVEVKE